MGRGQKRTASSMNDERWERRLNIDTAARTFEKEDADHSRYEPTSYAVLERLAGAGLIGKNDILVDYGCGKGRVGLYLNQVLGCRTIGVEYNQLLCDQANDNLRQYGGKGVSFVCENAENYAVSDANRFYFFNPFSVSILKSVLRRIYESYYESPREMRLFFYYATDPYLTCLLNEDMLQPDGDIDCRDLFDGSDSRERILIFRIAE